MLYKSDSPCQTYRRYYREVALATLLQIDLEFTFRIQLEAKFCCVTFCLKRMAFKVSDRNDYSNMLKFEFSVTNGRTDDPKCSKYLEEYE